MLTGQKVEQVLKRLDEQAPTVTPKPIFPVLAQEKNIPLKVIKLETREQAQSSPTPATIFSLFYNGEFITTDLSICMESKFLKLVKRQEEGIG